jgi:hypothetical protein
MAGDDNRLVTLERDMSDMKALMQKMVDAITRMALLEERQASVKETTDKILDQINDIREHQAAVELAAARGQVSPSRIEALEGAIRETHVEHERNKARFQTLVWTVRAAWIGGVAVVGVVAWLVQTAISMAPK